MKVVSATRARQSFAHLVDVVRGSNEPIGIRRHRRLEVVLMKYPDFLNEQLDEITNINALSRSFDFLREEPELYSRMDVIKKYV